MKKIVRNSRIGLSIFFIIVGVVGAFTEQEASILVLVLAMLMSFAIAYGFLPKDLKETLKSRLFKGYRPKVTLEKEPEPEVVQEPLVEVPEPVVVRDNQHIAPELEQWDTLSNRDFVNQLADFLIESGYEEVELIKAGTIVALKNGESYLFYCQRSDHPVAVTAIHELIANSRDFDLIKLVAITNDYFSDEAIDFAEETNVLLWNRETLSKLVMFYRN